MKLKRFALLGCLGIAGLIAAPAGVARVYYHHGCTVCAAVTIGATVLDGALYGVAYGVPPVAYAPPVYYPSEAYPPVQAYPMYGYGPSVYVPPVLYDPYGYGYYGGGYGYGRGYAVPRRYYRRPVVRGHFRGGWHHR